MLSPAIHGLSDELAISQLASIKWKSNLRGLTQIESKDDLKKRGIGSPDRAEAVMLAFADRTPTELRHSVRDFPVLCGNIENTALVGELSSTVGHRRGSDLALGSSFYARSLRRESSRCLFAVFIRLVSLKS